MEKLPKHLEMIQAVITRMAQNSFLLKGWSVTLVVALLGLGAKNGNVDFIVLAFLPAGVFWLLDGYYLSQERLFRALYEKVCQRDEGDVDFSMNYDSVLDKEERDDASLMWANSCFSAPVILFHLAVVGAIVLVMTLVA